MLREIRLPDGVPGRLFRSPLPGRWDWDLRRAERQINEQAVDLVVSLAGVRETREFAPRYARLIDDEDLPWEMWALPIADGGVPEDEEEFIDLARDIADELRGGVNVLIHCYAGIGRTGTLAIATLMALGVPPDKARRVVEDAGAGPESYAQERLIERLGRVLAQDEEH